LKQLKDINLDAEGIKDARISPTTEESTKAQESRNDPLIAARSAEPSVVTQPNVSINIEDTIRKKNIALYDRSISEDGMPGNKMSSAKGLTADRQDFAPEYFIQKVIQEELMQAQESTYSTIFG